MSTVYLHLAATEVAPHQPARAPLLERLLARADAPAAVTDWRRDAFALLHSGGAAPPPAVAAAAFYAEAGPSTYPWLLLATPVRCVAGMSSVRLPADGVLRLSAAQAAALAADFAATFGERDQRLLAAPSGALFLATDRVLEVATVDPRQVLGRDITDFYPQGRDGANLRRLQSEIELWLHDHAVNRERAAAGQPPLTGLWLWGGGASLQQLPQLNGWIAGRDPLFAPWPTQQRWPRGAQPGVIVLEQQPGSIAWREAERHWLEPAVARLKSGRLRRLELHLGSRRYRIGTAGLLRLWRRPRPWWEYFE